MELLDDPVQHCAADSLLPIMILLMQAHATLVTICVSYLLGSIPFGFLLVRIFHGEDVRTSGSGNIGATNVGRRSPALGIATLLLDAGKGLSSVLMARAIFDPSHQQLGMTVAAFCAILGHLYPVWLACRGGKGVATSVGSFALIVPKSVLCVIAVFLLVMAAARYVSLGSVTAAAAFPAAAWLLHEYDNPGQLLLMATAAVLIIWKHRQNIGRLLHGMEPRFGEKHG